MTRTILHGGRLIDPSAGLDGQRRLVRPLLRPVWTMVGGEAHRAADVAISLRPFLDADREVDCRIPI